MKREKGREEKNVKQKIKYNHKILGLAVSEMDLGLILRAAGFDGPPASADILFRATKLPRRSDPIGPLAPSL